MMILAFEFNYSGSHYVLENFLANCVDEFNLPLDLRRNKNILSLFVEGDEEFLLNFSDYLSKMLPTSIFVLGFNVLVVEERYGEPVVLKDCDLFLPFSIKMEKSVLDEKNSNFYNPFISSDVGIGLEAKEILTFKVRNELYSSEKIDFKTLFEIVAKEIFSGQMINVKTSTGNWSLSVVNEQNKNFNEKEHTIMPCDLGVIEKMVVVQDFQTQALGSLEKPQLRLPINTIYAEKNIIKDKFISMRLADDILLLLLTKELFSKGVEFIALKKCNEEDIHLTYEGGNIRDILQLSVLENGQPLILKDSMYTPKNLIKNLKAFDSHSTKQCAIVLKEYGLFDKSTACVYLSKEHDDEILVFSDKSGVVDLINLDFQNSGQELIDEICKKKNGKTLVSNFSNNFPQTFKNFCELDLSLYPKNLYTIFGAVGTLFGYENSVKNAAKTLLDNATFFSGLKGPRIDYFQEDSLRSKIDISRLISSGMSYHLAGLDDLTLSYGYIDSLGYFISDTLDKIQEEFETTHLILSGSLFENSRLSQVVARHAKITHTVCFNKEFPIDN